MKLYYYSNITTALKIFTSLNIYPIKYLQDDRNKKFDMAELFDFNEFVPLFTNIYRFPYFDQNEEKYDKICFELEIEPAYYKNPIYLKQSNSREFIKTDSSTEFDVILFKEPILINSKELIKHIICSTETEENLKTNQKLLFEDKGLSFKYKNINNYSEQYPFESHIMPPEISNELTSEQKKDYLLKDSFYGAKIANRYFYSNLNNPVILKTEKLCKEVINYLAAGKEQETQDCLNHICEIFKKQFHSEYEEIFKEIYELSYYFVKNEDKRPGKLTEKEFLADFNRSHKKVGKFFYDLYLDPKTLNKSIKLFNIINKIRISSFRELKLLFKDDKLTRFAGGIFSDVSKISISRENKIKNYDKKRQKKFDQLSEKIETILNGKYDFVNKIRNDQARTLANLPKKLKQQDFEYSDFKKLSIIILRIHPYYITFLFNDISKKIPFLLKMKSKSKEKEDFNKELNFIKDILGEIEKNIKLLPIDNKNQYRNHIKIENSKIITNDLIEEDRETINFLINIIRDYKNRNLNNSNINFEEIDHPNIAKMIQYIGKELRNKNEKNFKLFFKDDFTSIYHYYNKGSDIKNLQLASVKALNLFFENTKVNKINNIIESDKSEEVRLLSISFWGVYNGFTKISREIFKIAIGSLELKDFFDMKNQQNIKHEKKSKTEIKNDNKDKNKSKLNKDSRDTKNEKKEAQTSLLLNETDSPEKTPNKIDNKYNINLEIDDKQDLMNEQKNEMENIKKFDPGFKNNKKYIDHEKMYKEYKKKIDELEKKKEQLEKTKK